MGPVVTDGPFAETKEQLLGFYVVDCASQDEALADRKRTFVGNAPVVLVRSASDDIGAALAGAIADRFRHMQPAHAAGAIEIGDGACNAQHTAIGAGRKRKRSVASSSNARPASSGAHSAVERVAVGFGVGGTAAAPAKFLHITRFCDACADDGAAFALRRS